MNKTNIYTIQPSKILIWLLLFIYGGAGVGILVLPVSLYAVKLPLLLWCVATFGYQYWRYVLFGGACALKAFAHIGSGRWALITHKKSAAIEGRLQKSSVALPCLVVLHFKVIGIKKSRFLSLVVFSDAMSDDDFRRLRVELQTVSKYSHSKNLSAKK